MTKLLLEYFKYQEEYETKYGENTVVLIQIGSFYNFYTYDPEKSTETVSWPERNIGKAVQMSQILNMNLTKNNGNKPYSLSNPNMCGFPTVAYHKYRDVILANDYTIVKIDQRKEGKTTTRYVAEILSPATVIDDISAPMSNSIVSLYIEIQKEAVKFEDYLLITGISSIDVTTGSNLVSEIYSQENNALHALQEIYRFLISTNPREIIINLEERKKNTDNSYEKFIRTTLGLDNYTLVLFRKGIEASYLKASYQIQFLTKLFNNRVVKDNLILEELGLERLHYGTISYICLLQYCYEHNEKLIEKISNPDTGWIDEDKHLILTHNALEQLNVTYNQVKPKVKKDSLFGIVNHTSTVLGKRFLMQMLSNPITDDNETLQKYYDMTEELVNNSDLSSSIETHLKEIPDLERYQRKLQLRLISPSEFTILFRAYSNIVKLYTLIYESKGNLTNLLFDKVVEFNSCLAKVLSKYNINNLYDSKLEDTRLISTSPIFYTGADSLADQHSENVDESTQKLNTILGYLNSLISATRGKKIEYESKKGVSLYTTNHKASIIKKSNYDKNIVGELQFVIVKKEVMISSNKIAEICSTFEQSRKELSEYFYRCYMNTLDDISNCTFFNQINIFVKKLDYIKSNAKAALKFKYYKPELINSETSCLEFKDIRHPVVERIIDTEYIVNDISLGKDHQGILLFGANALGKSTLAKALALNILMAQAGMFTAGKLKYKPYRKILTRITGNDDLLRGKSSFVVEMTELRTILRNADNRCLVVGDELSKGTESISGTALTVAAISTLIDKKSSFIFSTHLHALVDNKYIKAIGDKLKISHLALRYDEEVDSLIYERKLKDGSGDSIYGLEVAKSLSLDRDFINLAIEIRKDLIGQNQQLLNTKKSKYNSNLYMDSCISCGKKVTSELESHHIQEQMLADEDGFINHYHKNSAFNLVTLCKECHNNLHSNNLKIVSVETSKGNIVTIPMTVY